MTSFTTMLLIVLLIGLGSTVAVTILVLNKTANDICKALEEDKLL